MSKVGRGLMVRAMLGHIVSSLQLGHIIQFNQAIVHHSSYRLAVMRSGLGYVSSMEFRCFIVNRLQPNAQREAQRDKHDYKRIRLKIKCHHDITLTIPHRITGLFCYCLRDQF
ncbi:hypothetical protein BsWGS_10370 [Bradybaena similaris]